MIGRVIRGAVRRVDAVTAFGVTAGIGLVDLVLQPEPPEIEGDDVLDDGAEIHR